MKCALIILDGFGNANGDKGNAVKLAHTPNIDALFAKYPTACLDASGLAVGLPSGQMGNSEVGHLNLGAGRVVYQDITAIDKSITDGDFFTNPALAKAIEHAKSNNGYVHLMGLASDGGVHSHINHLYALLEMCKRHEQKRVWIHAITDGRDTDPKSALEFIQQIESKCREIGVGKIATVSGRYYAMDRDNRTERTTAAFENIIGGEGDPHRTATACVKSYYKNNVTDEFIVPSTIGDYVGFEPEDAMVFFNFRSDRARQITRAIVDCISNINAPFVSMTQYDKTFSVDVAFPPRNLTNTLGEVLSKNDLTQVRLAETEKYAHVTSFFNGGVEAPNKGETRVLIPSPKVSTYDLAPEMSAHELCARAIAEIGKHDVMIVNFANCDMVGHTGDINAAIRAVETVDACVGQLVDAILAKGATVILTADHGNAEQMLTPEGTPFTAHTTNPVPIVIMGIDTKTKLANGRLCDVAPTVLKILGIAKPVEMDGVPLF